MLTGITNSICTKTANAYDSFSLPSANEVVQNVNKIAIPAIVLIAATNMATADAGPITEVACYAACGAAALTPWGFFSFPAWMTQCLSVCTLTGFLPIP